MTSIFYQNKKFVVHIYQFYRLRGDIIIDHNEKDGGICIYSTFYQNALRASRVNDWIKMTRNNLMMRNFSTTKKLFCCLMRVQHPPTFSLCQLPQMVRCSERGTIMILSWEWYNWYHRANHAITCLLDIYLSLF